MKPSVFRLVLPTLALGALFAASACSSDSGGTKKGPCTTSALDGCGDSCSAESACPDGLYCGDDGTCTADCTPAGAASDCDDGQSCSDEGRCVGGGDGSGNDGGSGDGSDGSGGDGSGNDGSSGDGDGGNVCASVELKPTPTVPNVIFVIDQSGSMTTSFGDVGMETRWTALKKVLLADDGLIATLQDRVDFGVALYSGKQNDSVCPFVSTVAVAENNLDAIKAVYDPANPRQGTPTGESLETVLASPELAELLEEGRPTIFILATDGAPNTCANPGDTGSAEATGRSVMAVEQAFDRGIRTYVVAVAEEDELPQDHVQALANAGVGMTGATSYRVDSVAALESNLTDIVSGALSCTVPLRGTVTSDDPCVGEVTLNGAPLECGGANGWHLDGDSTLVVDGTACDTLKAGGELKAVFPCGTVIVPQ